MRFTLFHVFLNSFRLLFVHYFVHKVVYFIIKYHFSYKKRLGKSFIVYSLTFQRESYFGVSWYGIEDQQYGTEGIFKKKNQSIISVAMWDEILQNFGKING